MKKQNKSKIKVFIADDHAIVRKGLRLIFSETPDLKVVGEAENGSDLLQKVRKVDVDVVLMDIGMPEKNGWDVLIQLKNEHSRLPVLILSIYPEEDYAVQFLKAGASGYLSKTSAPEQLVAAVRKVAQGGKFISPGLAEKLVSDLGKDSEKPLHSTLSPRELQILCLIASGKTVKEIAGELALSVPTISTYRGRILEKMNMKTSAQLIHYAVKNRLVE